MIDRWKDLEQLRKDGRRVLRWIQREGVVMSWDPSAREKAARYLLPVFHAMEDVILSLPLVSVYLYRQADQPPGLRTDSGAPMSSVDGIQWTDATPDRGKLYAIGVSVEAVDSGPDYLQFLFLHELTHIFSGGEHSPKFHRQLDALIAKFNRQTGSHIVNDYCK